jgi:hypothetical protein
VTVRNGVAGAGWIAGPADVPGAGVVGGAGLLAGGRTARELRVGPGSCAVPVPVVVLEQAVSAMPTRSAAPTDLTRDSVPG